MNTTSTVFPMWSSCTHMSMQRSLGHQKGLLASFCELSNLQVRDISMHQLSVTGDRILRSVSGSVVKQVLYGLRSPRSVHLIHQWNIVQSQNYKNKHVDRQHKYDRSMQVARTYCSNCYEVSIRLSLKCSLLSGKL